MVEEFEFTLLGLHDSADTSTGATRLKETAWEEPFRLAVMLADCVPVIVPTVAVNVAELLFAATVTDAGTVRAALLSDKATTLPPVGAT